MARSGTTWLAEIVASALNARLMFEPFHDRYVPRYEPFEFLQYKRPEDDDPELLAFVHDVLSGKIRNPAWVDALVGPLRPSYRIVKEVHICLCLRWLRDRFPQVPIVYVIRHPCALAASFRALDWTAQRDMDSILAQRMLIEDYLADHVPLIRGATQLHRKVAVLWCVNNLVALRQFADTKLDVVFFEDLLRDTRKVLLDVFRAIGRPFDESILSATDKPSATARSRSPMLRSRDPSAAWTSDLTAPEVDEIMEIVQAFGLGHLYDERGLPSGSVVG
jgi:hypothetical protein